MARGFAGIGRGVKAVVTVTCLVAQALSLGVVQKEFRGGSILILLISMRGAAVTAICLVAGG